MTHDRPLDAERAPRAGDGPRRRARRCGARTSRHDPAQRTFHPLLQTEHAIAWLICWMPGHDTGFHDHDGCSGAVAVVEGAVREERIRWAHVPGGPHDRGRRRLRLRRRRTSIASCTPGTGPAVTIHAYSPVPARHGRLRPRSRRGAAAPRRARGRGAARGRVRRGRLGPAGPGGDPVLRQAPVGHAHDVVAQQRHLPADDRGRRRSSARRAGRRPRSGRPPGGTRAPRTSRASRG